METTSAREGNLLEPDARARCRQIELKSPILTNEELDKLRQLMDLPGFKSVTLPILFRVSRRRAGPGARRWTSLCRQADAGDRGRQSTSSSSRTAASNQDCAPIPALLAVAGVHHHLIREGTRTQVGLVLEAGEPREVHHFALLIGYGCGAINPYLAFETLDDMIQRGPADRTSITRPPARTTSRRSSKGVVKVMSKMGISTIQSYCGAQIFEAVGLKPGRHRQVLHLDALARRRRRARRHRPGSARCGTSAAFPDRAGQRPRARRRRPVPVARGRRVPPVQPGDHPQAADGRAAPATTRSSRNTPSWSTTRPSNLCTLRGLFEFKPRQARSASTKSSRSRAS